MANLRFLGHKCDQTSDWQPAVAQETAPQKHMESTWALSTLLRQNSEAGVAFTRGIQFT